MGGAESTQVHWVRAGIRHGRTLRHVGTAEEAQVGEVPSPEPMGLLVHFIHISTWTHCGIIQNIGFIVQRLANDIGKK